MIVTRDFNDLPLFHYRAILADCPWLFKNWSEKGEAKNPNQHYDCMSIDQIKEAERA